MNTSEYITHHLHNLDFNLATGHFGGSGFWVIHLDTLSVSWVLGLLFFCSFWLVARKVNSGMPGAWQNVVEAAVEWIEKLSEENFMKHSSMVAPLALTIFVWILLINFMDLVPVDLFPTVLSWFGVHYFRSVPTSDPCTTFALSLSVFILLIIYNIRFKGLIGVTKEIFSAPFGWYLLPINVFFHTMEAFVKPFSLSLRLFGNLFAGEMIFILIAGLIPWYAQWMVGVPWALLHGLIITIQAFVFMLLTVVYLNIAAELHEAEY